MTPNQIKVRRLELGMTVAELARELDITERELTQIENGQNTWFVTQAFEKAFERLEERAFATYMGAPVYA
jgi:transcriptional regulator with XRE-family HTH domain